MNDQSSETKGILFVVVSYVIWGLFPLYWRLLDGVPAVEIALHRIVWCALCVGLWLLVRGRTDGVRATLHNRRRVAALTASGFLVAADWSFYIYGVETRQLVETSLGMFVVPLFSIFLGVAFLGERLSPMRAFAIALGVAALGVEVCAYGRVPWIAIGLAVSFGLYGYVRKLTPVDPIDGLFVETALLVPLALAGLIGLAALGRGAFRPDALWNDSFLVLSGIVTAIPLALFVAGARRIRLSTVGFVQYCAPGLTLSLAVFGFGERFSHIDAAAFGCLWGALILIALESRFRKAGA